MPEGYDIKMGRQSICLRKILDEITRHDLWVKQKNRPVKHTLLIQFWLLYPCQFLIGRLPKLHPSLLHGSSKILYTTQ